MLRRHKVDRIIWAFVVLGLPLLLVAGFLSDNGVSAGNAIAILIVVGPPAAVLFFRGNRIRVECRPGEVTVYKMWSTVRIPPTQIIAIDTFAAEIRWQAPDRTQRVTKVTAFRSNKQALRSLENHGQQRMDDLRIWLQANR